MAWWSRRIIVKLKLLGESVVVRVVAHYKPDGGPGDSIVRKSTVDGKWETHYIYDTEHGEFGVPRAVTYEISTKRKVAETRSLVILGEGLFGGEEICYAGDQEVFRSRWTRYVGTGLLVDERVENGTLPADYHHYELVLQGWPAGSSLW